MLVPKTNKKESSLSEVRVNPSSQANLDGKVSCPDPACSSSGKLYVPGRGLSQHQRRAHPVEYFEASRPKTTRSRGTAWSEAEEKFYAWKEAELLVAAAPVVLSRKQILAALSLEGGKDGRSSDSILKRRQLSAYQGFVEEFRREIQEQRSSGPGVGGKLECPFANPAEDFTLVAGGTSLESNSEGGSSSDGVGQPPVQTENMEGLEVGEAGAGASNVLDKEQAPQATEGVGRDRETGDGGEPPGDPESDPNDPETPQAIEGAGRDRQPGDGGGPPSDPDSDPNDPEPRDEVPPDWVLALKTAICGDMPDLDVHEIVPDGGAVNQAAVDRLSAQILSTLPPKEKRPQRRRPAPVNITAMSRRKQRQVQYQRLQRTLRRDFGRGAKSVVSGTWNKQEAEVPLASMTDFWKPLFETESVEDSRFPEPVREEQMVLLRPFDSEELNLGIANSQPNSASGPDGRDLKQIKACPIGRLRACFNLWLLAGCVPKELYEGRTVLIPKEVGTEDPQKFRPITISSVLVRLYHKLLSTRMENACPTSTRQKAFKSGDGIYENITILKGVLKDAAGRKAKPLALAFLDVRKAFDSVSHDSLLIACRRVGVPSPLLNYIGMMYREGFTRLSVGGEESGPIYCKQGVKQGDPLSTFLFNIVIDWALSSLDENIGYKVGDSFFNHLAFADDVCLLAQSYRALQSQIDCLTSHLAKCGLTVNAAKCSSLALRPQRSRKSYWVETRPFVSASGVEIPVLSPKQLYKYLGIHFGPTNSEVTCFSNLKKMLGEVSKAPLKPHQRLLILKQNVLPAMLHQCVLGEVTIGQLLNADRQVRIAARRWLKLPKDCPNEFFHTAMHLGGLGIMSLRCEIPALRVKRMKNFISTSDPVAQSVVLTDWFTKEYRKWNLILDPAWSGSSSQLEDPSTRAQLTAEKLYSSVDGKGLKHAGSAKLEGFTQKPVGSAWVRSQDIPGSRFCSMLALRAGVLKTGARRARCLPPEQEDLKKRVSACDACFELDGTSFDERGRPLRVPRRDTLAHRLQTCVKTHGYRVSRHNRILKILNGMLKKRKFRTLREPVIATSRGRRIPDLIAHTDNDDCPSLGRKTYVLDVAICGDNLTNPDQLNLEKTNYYQVVPEVRNFAKDFGCEVMEFGGVVFSWRGIPSPGTVRLLTSLGLRRKQLELLAQVVVEQGVYMFRAWESSGHRLAPRARGL